MDITFRRKRFFWFRLGAFVLIVVACGVGFIWNGLIEDFTNRNILGNERPPSDLNFDGGMSVHFIDVGQGDAAVIQFPGGEVMIIDAGGTTNTSRNAFSNFLTTNIFPGNTPRDVTWFIATHSHADHIGAATYLMTYYNVQNVIRPLSFTQAEINANVHIGYGISTPTLHDTMTFRNFVTAMYASNADVEIPYRGKVINIGSNGAGGYLGEVKFLSPGAYYFGGNINRLSTIFTVTFAGTTIMFTGDAYVACENEMLAYWTTYHSFDFSSVDILDVGHHGSTTSTGQPLINATQPSYAIIQVGMNNRYGHPHSAITRRLDNAGVTTLRTSLYGDILIRVSADGQMLEVAGAIAPGQWFSYWMLVATIVTVAFGTLLAMDFFGKKNNGNTRNNARQSQNQPRNNSRTPRVPSLLRR